MAQRTDTVPPEERPQKPTPRKPVCGACNVGQHDCKSERCTCPVTRCVKARRNMQVPPERRGSSLVGTEHAPKPGEPKFKLTLSEPPGQKRGREARWKEAAPLLEELKAKHPGEWACIAEFPPNNSKANPANSLQSALRKQYSNKEFELAARKLPDGSFGLWARYIG